MKKFCTCMQVLVFLSTFIFSVNCATPAHSGRQNSSVSQVTVAAPAATTTTRRPILQDVRLPCTCQDRVCGCCTGLILERLRQKACLNVTYEPNEFAFGAAVILNDRILYRNSISGKNPPPVCVNLPRFRFIRLCIEFSNIYFANRNMHVCTAMEVNWASVTLLDFSFDCIRMGANGVAVLGPEAGGGLPLSPADQEEQTDEDYDDSARDVPLSEDTKDDEPFDEPSDRIVKVKKLLNGDFQIIFKKKGGNAKNND